MQRTKSCARRLKDYIEGKTERIEELEEKTLDFTTGGEPNPEKYGVSWNIYSVIATANVL